jgi:DNA processing protein
MARIEEDWLALSLVQGLGQKALHRLIDRFGSVAAILESDPAAISEAAKIDPVLGQRIARAREVDALRIERRMIEQHGVRLLCLESPEYPPLLRQIHAPPPLLFCRGEVPIPEGFSLSVVGTRRQSRYGEKVVRLLLGELARAVPDLVVISGLARGVDTTAHQVALELGLKTVAVLGGGLSGIYPPENRELAEAIANQGTLVSEFHMATPPLAKHFPIRNRIISGLSRGVLIAEAGEKSGALITAGFAVNHGREVFAVPGPIDHEGYAGSHHLIQKGQAKLVQKAQDILEEFDFQRAPRVGQIDWLSDGGHTSTTSAYSSREAALSEDQRRVLECLRDGPQIPDELAQATAIPVERLLGILLELELAGEIGQTSNNRYAMA